MRVGLDGVDLVDGLQVLVGPHVPSLRRGPRCRQSIVGDALRPVGELDVAVHAEHRVVAPHGLHDAAELDATAGAAGGRAGKQLIAVEHACGEAVASVEILHTALGQLPEGFVACEAVPHSGGFETLGIIDIVWAGITGEGLEPAVAVGALIMEGSRQGLERLGGGSIEVAVLENPGHRPGHVHPARGRPRGELDCVETTLELLQVLDEDGGDVGLGGGFCLGVLNERQHDVALGPVLVAVLSVVRSDPAGLDL